MQKMHTDKDKKRLSVHRQRERKRVQKPGALRILNFISVFL